MPGFLVDLTPLNLQMARPARATFSFGDGWVTSSKRPRSTFGARGDRASTHGGTVMKSAMGAVVALALGIGLAASAGATGMNRQGAMQSPNIQTGSTQQ